MSNSFVLTLPKIEVEEIFDDKTVIYNVKDAAELLGVHPQTLRNWEVEGLVNPHRISGGHRIYTGETLDTLEKIKTLKNLNFCSVAIRAIVNQQVEEVSV